MRVIIDERERDLYDKCISIVNSNVTYIQLVKEVLPLGDIYLKTDEGKDVLIIERKTIADLLASIKDGRYEEQSYRLLHSSGFPPHSVLYIIEGSLSTLRTPIEKKIFYSAFTSLHFFKGFSVIRTNHVIETAEHIIWMAEKIEKNFLKGIFPYYLSPSFHSNNNEIVDASLNEISGSGQEIIRNEITGVTTANYCSVVKKVKKENITPENIGEIILCQIPGISSVTAIAIMKKFSTFPNFIKEIETDPSSLENITYENNGKIRKINKTSIENIRKYLLSSVSCGENI